MASRSLYTELESELGDIGLLRAGTLEVALVPDDEGYLRRLYQFQLEQGLPVEWVPGHRLQEYESFVNRNLPCAIWSPEDVQVDNRKLVSRLVEELTKRGVVIRENEEVVSWRVKGDSMANEDLGSATMKPGHSGAVTVKTVKTDAQVDALVVATGTGAFPNQDIPYKIYPVRGEMISLTVPDYPFLQKTVRIRTKVLGNAYIVPKRDRILMGSTSEEKGLDASTTAGGMLDILRKCYAAVPGIYELNVQETWAGLRPSTLSRLPVCDQEGQLPIFHVNGLYRHGILMSPLLGKGITELILQGKRLPEIEPFRI